MKIKLFALMLFVTALALASQRPIWALGLCPLNHCGDVNEACLDDGGNPLLPVPTGETCYTLPDHTTYDIAIAYCQYPNTETFEECYW